MRIELGKDGMSPFRIIDDKGREIQGGLCVQSTRVRLTGHGQTMVELELYVDGNVEADFLRENLGITVDTRCEECRKVTRATPCPQP